MHYKKGIKGKLDQVFSLYIRTRDNWTCQKCKQVKPEKSLGYHCAHIKGRGKESVRWDENNAMGLCYGCHSFIDNNADEKKKWYVEKFGEAGWDELTVKANHSSHFKDDDVKRMIKHYKDKLEELKGSDTK